ncbi:MAG: PTS system mannose/fructose/sorbose family transporter subunit IID [Ethanoligenens sp.]|uniref:PTS system mannose/fructose/sorbose family transporter subunit IID n=1 Tax=Ethanoligenens sp. TaxID=2099655 RepID=UPI0039E81D1F
MAVTAEKAIQTPVKKVSQKTLRRSFLEWFYGNLTCFSQEHMQTFGYMCAMLPVIEELYDSKEEQKEAMQTYRAFFNTEPQIGTVVVGMTVGMEEAKANGEPLDGEAVNAIRAGLMGPLAGIGDSLIVGTLIPILLGVSLGMSTGGSPLGAIFYIVVWNLIAIFGMRFLFSLGYKLGGRAVEILVGEKANAVREAVTMIGTIVIGGVSASWIHVKTALTIVNGKVTILDLQKTLDNIYPGLLTAGFVILCWWLMTKKNLSPVIVMLLLVVVAFLGCLVGFFNPGLKY